MKNTINISALHIDISDIEFIETDVKNSCHLCLFYNKHCKYYCKKKIVEAHISVHINRTLGICFKDGKRLGYYKRKDKGKQNKDQLKLNL